MVRALTTSLLAATALCVFECTDGGNYVTGDAAGAAADGAGDVGCVDECHVDWAVACDELGQVVRCRRGPLGCLAWQLAEVCQAPEVCRDGACACQADCSALTCGPDPVCGESCGECSPSEHCVAGQCECVPVCATECGDNGCGGSCGACAPGWSCVDGTCAVDVVSIPAGTFWMGCNAEADDQCDPSELPYHEVTVQAFGIDATEVTEAAYWRCNAAGACWQPDGDCSLDRTSVQPVCGVTWEEAGDYCAWAGKRLCTEAEWERAARGDDGRVYPWGDDEPTCALAVFAWVEGARGCGADAPAEVGSRPQGASPFGVLDMAGSVHEWVLDDWHPSYEGAPADGSAWVDTPRSRSRVIRGGGWGSPAVFLRASSRGLPNPVTAGDKYVGFRCCGDVTP